MKDREHIIFNAFLLVLILFILRHFNINIDFRYGFLFGLGYGIGTLWLTPDLDTHSRARRRWLFLMPFWWLFDRLVHHGTITHRPVLGTFVLLLYTAFIVVLVVLILNILGLVNNETIRRTLFFMVKYPVELGWCIFGIVLGIWGI